MNKLAQLVAIVTIASGCSHTVVTAGPPVVSFYTSFETPVPGRWAVIVDESTTEFSTVIKMSSLGCAANSYAFDPGSNISTSIYETLVNVFEETSRHESMPLEETMREQQLAGAVLVGLDGFNASLACESGTLTWSFPCTSEASMSFGVQVNGRGGTLMDFSADALKTADGPSGAACGKVADLFSTAYQQALVESLQKMAEQLSDSEQLRAVANRQQ